MVLHPCKTLGKQLKHPCFRRSPNASLRSFVGFASCKTSVRTLSSILAWSQGRQPPIISPARMPGVYAKRLCTMQSPPSIHNPSPRGRGCRQGCLKVSAQSASGRCATERSQRDRKFALLIKKIDLFDKLIESYETFKSCRALFFVLLYMCTR